MLPISDPATLFRLTGTNWLPIGAGGSSALTTQSVRSRFRSSTYGLTTSFQLTVDRMKLKESGQLLEGALVLLHHPGHAQALGLFGVAALAKATPQPALSAPRSRPALARTLSD